MREPEKENVRMHPKIKLIESTPTEKIMSNGMGEESGKPAAPDVLLRRMSPENVRERMERLRNDVVNHVGDQFDDMMSDVLNNIEVMTKFDGTNALRLEENEKLYYDKRKPEKNGTLPVKQFLRRNSVLTDLYDIKHFKTIYNIFIVILILMSLNTAIYDLLHTGSTNLGITFIMRGFAKFSIVIKIWLGMLASTFGVYLLSNYWAQRRVTMTPQSYSLKIWDYGWLVLYVTYQITLICLPTKLIVWADLPPVSRVVILTEQVRMVMKIHAFVRSSVPLVTSYKPHSDDEEFTFPSFSKFLYFMFVPTLIYRESYPRTEKIRWRFALWHFTEVVLVIFNMAFLFERYLLPPFIEFGKHPFDGRSFILAVYGSSVPGMLIFLSGFYCLLHAWMNAAAEVMRFGDRMFYKDWWNSTNYATFYRHWNVVVHDWLYAYIYKDMYEIVTPGNRFFSTFAVFSVSAIFHEFIVGFTFSMFFPVMLLMFGVIGYLLIFIIRTGHSSGNMFMWFSLFTGSGTMISLYAMEYFARVNCPPYDDGILDLFLPRSFICF